MSVSRRVRVLLVILGLVSLYAIGKLSGAFDDLDAEHLRAMVDRAGPWGVPIYVLLFVIGQLLHIPGLVLQAAGILVWGRFGGFGVSWLAALVSVSVTFVIVRAAGGKALDELESPRVKKLLARAEARPILTVILVRTVFWLAPWSTYALALSHIRYRDFLMGSAVGLAAPMLGAAFVFERLFR